MYTPSSAQLWNNIGMCFFGKQRYVAAIACLKRALYLDPFEWIISYNLGLVHLNTGQYASAFHYFSTSINLKPDFPSSYMYLGITLNRLDDFENACAAYEKAIDMEEDHLFELNYAITLFNNDEMDKARAHYAEFEKLWARLDEDTKNADQEVVEQAHETATAPLLVLATLMRAPLMDALRAYEPDIVVADFMAPAAEALTAGLKDTPISTPKIPVISNVNVEAHIDADAIRATLAKQVSLF